MSLGTPPVQTAHRPRIGTVETGPGSVQPPGGSFGSHIHIHVSSAGFDDFVTTYRLARGERQGRTTIVLVSSL